MEQTSLVSPDLAVCEYVSKSWLIVVYEPKEKYSLGYLSNNVYIFLKPSTLGYVVIFFKPLSLDLVDPMLSARIQRVSLFSKLSLVFLLCILYLPYFTEMKSSEVLQWPSFCIPHLKFMSKLMRFYCRHKWLKKKK